MVKYQLMIFKKVSFFNFPPIFHPYIHKKTRTQFAFESLSVASLSNHQQEKLAMEQRKKRIEAIYTYFPLEIYENIP